MADWQTQDELYRQAAVAHRAVFERWARAYEADLDKGVMHVRKWTYDVGLWVRRTPQGYRRDLRLDYPGVARHPPEPDRRQGLDVRTQGPAGRLRRPLRPGDRLARRMA